MEPAGGVASKRIVDETKQLYSSLLRRPLDERQLAKPSFKFILDLVLSLISETKLLKEFTGSLEIEAKRRAKVGWDRRAKVELVQQLIDFVANNKQQVTRCAASKLVAGLEPNKTNELLQALARVASQRQLAKGPPGGTGPLDLQRRNTFTKRPPQIETRPKQVARNEINPVASGASGASDRFDLHNNETSEANKLVVDQRPPATRDATFVVEPKRHDEAPKRASSLSGARVNTTGSLKEAIEQTRARLKSLQSILVDIDQLDSSLSDSLF